MSALTGTYSPVIATLSCSSAIAGSCTISSFNSPRSSSSLSDSELYLMLSSIDSSLDSEASLMASIHSLTSSRAFSFASWVNSSYTSSLQTVYLLTVYGEEAKYMLLGHFLRISISDSVDALLMNLWLGTSLMSYLPVLPLM